MKKELLSKMSKITAVEAEKVELAVNQSKFNEAVNDIKRSLATINREKSVIKASQKQVAGFIRDARADVQELNDLSRQMEKNDMNGAAPKKKAAKLDNMVSEAIKVMNDAKAAM